MSAVEIVAGGFASAAIRKFVDAAGGYLSNRYGLDKETEEMLNSLNNTMRLMEAIMEAAEKQQIYNEGLIQWQNLIQNAAYEAEDVLDDFEAKSICEDLNGKGKVRKVASSIAKGFKNLIFPKSGDVKDVKKLKAVIKNLEQLGKQCSTFVGLLNLDQNGQPSTNSRESTQILPYGQRLFGRDSEINLILTILGYDRESLEGEVISGGDEDSARATSFVGIIFSKIPFMIRKNLTESFGQPVGEMGEPSSQKDAMATSSLASRRGKDPIPSEMSSDRGKLMSLDSGLTLGVKNSNPISGQDKAQKFLLEMDPIKYMGPRGKPFVIPIVGISGVGKTALALKIYELLKGHFGISRWVYMAGKFDVTKIVQALSPSFDRNVDPYSLQNEIITTIVGKKIFLVFDDVAGEACSQLLDLLTWFNTGVYGSVILITTQEHKVANIVRTVEPISLDPMEWDYFLPILEYYTFRNADVANEQKEALRPILENIGRKLYGLPLAAKIIGSLLRYKLHETNEWSKISRSNLWDQNKSSIVSTLKLSYEHLDVNLKHCFAFCSIFPRNTIIQRDRLIQLWIANSFILLSSDNNSDRLEDIGNELFNKLVDRSFFLPTPWPQMFTMHSAVRELAIAISSNKEGFVIDDNLYPCLYGCSLLNENLDTCPHGYFLPDNDLTAIPPNTHYLTVRRNKLCQDFGGCAKVLRTLLFHGIYPPDENSVKVLRNLRALELSYPRSFLPTGYMQTIYECLSHLRFLDLSYTGITEIPESICNLCHLQVLDIRGCEFQNLPKKMNHLINLRHLYASKETVFLISGIGKLTKLQELEEFRVTRNYGHTIIELAEMNEIGGHLSVVDLVNVINESEAVAAKLAEKTHLKALSLEWDTDRCWASHADTSEKILCSLKPHEGLEKLEIKNFPCHKVPSALFPLNIRHIYFENCEYLENLPPFGELCHLETLVLKNMPNIYTYEESYGFNSKILPAVKVLKFISMNMKAWLIVGENRNLIPLLEELEIRDCSNLIETPLQSMLLSKLKKLVLSNCVGILEGTLNDKPLPLLNSLYISGNQSSITLHPYKNFPNLRVLSIEKLCVELDENSRSLLNLKSLILNNAKITWNREPIFPELVEIKVLLAGNDIGERILAFNYLGDITYASPPSLKVLNIQGNALQSVVNINREENYMYRKYRSMLEDWFARLDHIEELTADNIGLPELSFSNLSSLKRLNIKSGLQSIPLNGMPSKLKELYVYEASSGLQNRCCPEGEDWLKIKHIPCIIINGKPIQMLES